MVVLVCWGLCCCWLCLLLVVVGDIGNFSRLVCVGSWRICWLKCCSWCCSLWLCLLNWFWVCVVMVVCVVCR